MDCEGKRNEQIMTKTRIIRTLTIYAGILIIVVFKNNLPLWWFCCYCAVLLAMGINDAVYFVRKVRDK